MPTFRSYACVIRQAGPFGGPSWLLAGLIMVGLSPAVTGEATRVRSQEIALHYHFQEAGPSTRVELWYSRDRGSTWHRYGVDEDGQSPMIFKAPSEGLFGLILIARDGQRASSAKPQANDPAQRWVFVDPNPPLLQWQTVEPCEDFARRRVLRLSWTAYDNHLPARPVRLAYRGAADTQWTSIGADLPNTGRYDWSVPDDLPGQVTLKISVRDRGGHVVERLCGPLQLQDWLRSEASRPTTRTATHPSPGPATQPAAVPATRPQVDPLSHDIAEQRYKQGSWHLLRGQYELAAARFREAIELDPANVPALNDLAGIHYLKKDYGRSIELYQRALASDMRDRQALRGAALAYVAQRDYAKSREMLRRLLGFYEHDAEALLDLGDVLFMMGNRPRAIRTWNRALNADSSAAEVIRKARQRLELYRKSPGSEHLPVSSDRGAGENR